MFVFCKKSFIATTDFVFQMQKYNIFLNCANNFDFFAQKTLNSCFFAFRITLTRITVN